MKLLRFGEAGAEKPGLLDAAGQVRDLSGIVSDIGGATLGQAELDRLRALDTNTLPMVEGSPRLGPCVAPIGKLICIGLNFSDHAAETGAAVPEYPIVFMKANSAINGPYDDIVLPRSSVKADWEVELGVVIGTKCKYATQANAMDHVAGFCIVNDVSERTFQKEMSGQWTKGKSPDTFGPVGPWMVTRDEVGDCHTLDMYTEVNGERMQTGNSDKMIFSVPYIIEHLSQIFTLHPGDVISTGTPPGVGDGMTPPRYLKPGDVMEIGISGLGHQRQNIRRED